MPLPPAEMGSYMEQLVTSRRSCRRFLDKNVDPVIITRILSAMAAAPTGGNAQSVEYTVIDDKDRVQAIRQAAYAAPWRRKPDSTSIPTASASFITVK